jgi:hypothetical protein
LRVVLNQRGQARRDRLKLTDVLVEFDLELRALGDGVAVVVIDAELDVVRQGEQIFAEGFQVGQDVLDTFTRRQSEIVDARKNDFSVGCLLRKVSLRAQALVQPTNDLQHQT